MSAKHAAVRFLVEPDKQSLADLDGGGSQVAGWAEHGGNSVVPPGVYAFELGDLFTFGHNEFAGGVEQLFGVSCLQLLAGGYLLFYVD